jgi:hypothetical protein
MADVPQYTVSAKYYAVRVWQPGVGPRIVSCDMSDLQAADLSTQNILSNGVGVPAAGLPAGFTNYLPGDRYFDYQGKQGYVCTGAGTNVSSSWQTDGGGGSGAVQQFKISYDAGDYWAAYTWDGTNLGTILYSIVKPYKLRAGFNAIQSEVVRGVTYTYAYAVNGGASTPGNYYQRSVSGSDGSSELDYITDPLQNDVIYAMPCSTNIAGSIPCPVLSASLVSPGTGYAPNEVLICGAPVGNGGQPAWITVNTVDGQGKILTYTLTKPGGYSVPVTNPAPFGGATFNLTIQGPLIDINTDGRYWEAQ